MELKSWDSCKVTGIKSGTMTFGLSLWCSSPWKCKSCSSCSFPTGDPGLPASGNAESSVMKPGEGLGEAALPLLFWFSWNLLPGRDTLFGIRYWKS